MIAEKGRKVYLRRDISAYQEAWIFDAKTDNFLGKGFAVQSVPFMATTPVEKAQFKKALAVKRKEQKVIREFLQSEFNPTNTEIVANISRIMPETNDENNPQIVRLSNTQMDKVVQEQKHSEATVEKYVTPLQPKKKLYLTESEKRRDLEQRAM